MTAAMHMDKMQWRGGDNKIEHDEDVFYVHFYVVSNLSPWIVQDDFDPEIISIEAETSCP